MDSYVPLSKRSKKEQKAFNELRRRGWNGVNPMTRTFPDGRTYDRKKARQETRRTFEEY